MKMSPHVLGILVAVSLPLLGCSSPEKEVSHQLGVMIAVVDEGIAQICSCWQELGHGSESECNGNRLADDEVECLRTVLQRRPEEGLELVNCYLALYRAQVDCISESLSCSETNAVEHCDEAFTVGQPVCEALHPAIDDELNGCTASE